MQGQDVPGTSIISIPLKKEGGNQKKKEKNNESEVKITNCQFHSQLSIFKNYIMCLIFNLFTLIIIFVKKVIASRRVKENIAYIFKLAIRY